MKKLLALSMMPLLGACNGLFYYPLREDIHDPKDFRLHPEDVSIPTEDGLELAAWWFPATQAPLKKLVIHFHGNAENMTSHFLFTAWLSQEGFDVLIFDYRGYGRSTSVPPTREGLVKDGCAVFRWVERHPRLKDYEVHVIGQSLGGAVAIPSLALCPLPQVKSLVIDSSFSSYRRIAQDKLASSVIMWPLQIPLSYLVTDDLSPIDSIERLPMKMLFLHNADDPVVPYKLGKELHEKAVAPKTWVDVKLRGHTSALAEDQSPYRAQLVKFLRD